MRVAAYRIIYRGDRKNKYYDSFYKCYDRKSYRCDRKSAAQRPKAVPFVKCCWQKRERIRRAL